MARLETDIDIGLLLIIYRRCKEMLSMYILLPYLETYLLDSLFDISSYFIERK